MRRGASVGATDAPGTAEGGPLDTTCPGVGDAPAMGPGTARMLATIQAVKRPPATARTSTTTAAITHPVAPLEPRVLVAGAPALDGGGGAGVLLGEVSSVTCGE